MKVDDIKKKADALGIKPGKLSKKEIILKIQTAEGNYPCFGTAVDYCDQENCVWKEDCLTK